MHHLLAVNLQRTFALTFVKGGLYTIGKAVQIVLVKIFGNDTVYQQVDVFLWQCYISTQYFFYTYRFVFTFGMYTAKAFLQQDVCLLYTSMCIRDRQKR